MESDDLLAQAHALWTTTKIGYRDGMIRVGQLLHRYVKAYLKAGDALNEQERRRRRLTRDQAVVRAADALRCRNTKINELIRLGAAAELLAPPGGFGALSYSSVRALRVVIVRPHRGKGRVSRVKGADDGLLPPSALEDWAIKPGYEGAARELVADAVAGAWDESQVVGGLRALLRRPARRGTAPHPYTQAVRYGDEEGLLDEALTVLLAADDPDAMLAALRDRLERVRRGSWPDPHARDRALRQYEAAAAADRPLFLSR